MTIAQLESPRLTGVTQPRIAPPLPARSLRKQYREVATALKIKLIPWQDLAAHYLCAIGPTGWLFREICIVVARQNGKTELLVPRIVMDLRAGKRILHTAHRMRLPRKVFLRVARVLKEEAASIRYAQGQEEIFMPNGGSYSIVAALRGARGDACDTLIIDELREIEDDEVLAATQPTTTASSDPQIIYLSNAGSEESLALNALRRRGETGGEGSFAYLEWSAAPELAIDDRAGWEQANPSLGYLHMQENLEREFLSLSSAKFETECLCRWVTSMQPALVNQTAWMQCETTLPHDPERPAIAFNMSADGRRASAAMAWQLANGRVACIELAEANGNPIDVERLGPDIQKLVRTHSAKQVGYASWTDKDLARFIPRAKALDGKEFAAASEKFARMVTSGQLAWDGATHVTADLPYTTRKLHDESGAWVAVPASSERSITAMLAAIRATWLASAPRSPVPRIG